MFIYYIIIFLVAVPGLFVKNNTRDLYMKWAFCVLVFFSAFRNITVGGDLINYIPYFNYVNDLSWRGVFSSYDKYGLIFRIIIKLSCLVSSNANWILFILSLINLSGPLIFIKRYSRISWLSVFLYISLAYYTNTFNSLRASMALSIGLIGIMNLMQNRRLQSLLLFAIAIEIHKTIFPILALYYIFKIKPTFWKITTPIIITVLFSNALSFTSIKGIIEQYNAMNNYSEVIDKTSGTGYSLLILYIVVTISSYLCLKNRLNKSNSFLILLMMYATCIQAMAPLYSYITRISLFFSIAIVILIPNVLNISLRKDIKPIAISLIFMLGLLFFNIKVLTPVEGSDTNSQGTIPYEFVWG